MSLPFRFTPSFLLLLFLLAASCKNNLEEARLVVSRANANIEKGENVLIQYSDNGVTRIQCYGKTATRYNTEKPYLEFSDGIKIEFFKEDGSIESTLTARYATAVENSKEMVARDSVVVVNQKGERLNTDELVWDENKKVIYSNTFVKISTADEIIYGKGFYANQNFSDYVVKSISGKIKVNAGELE